MRRGMRGPVVLFTDFGLRDPYVGVMKGVILGINPRASLVDLWHGVEPQNIGAASYWLSVSFPFFPSGSLFVCVVDPGVGGDRGILCAWGKEYIFLAPDNGLLTRVVRREPSLQVLRVTNNKLFLSPVSATFHGRDIFAPVAAHLSLGLSPREVGERVSKIKEIPLPEPLLRKGQIRGEVIHVDHFGNLVTNIDRDVFERAFGHAVENRVVRMGRGREVPLLRCYQDVKPGKGLGYFGSFGCLEMGIHGGRADEFFSVGIGGKVIVV